MATQLLVHLANGLGPWVREADNFIEVVSPRVGKLPFLKKLNNILGRQAE